MTEVKTEEPGLYRSSDGVLINKDNQALRAYKQKKIEMKKISDLEKTVTDMKGDLEEIKNLLKGLAK